MQCECDSELKYPGWIKKNDKKYIFLQVHEFDESTGITKSDGDPPIKPVHLCGTTESQMLEIEKAFDRHGDLIDLLLKSSEHMNKVLAKDQK